MNPIVKNLQFMLENVIKRKRNQDLLITTDSHIRSVHIGQAAMEAARSMGIQAVIATMENRTHQGQEPPAAISAAMKQVGAIIDIAETVNLGHTTARKDATALGIGYYVLCTDVSEDYFMRPLSIEDLEQIKKRSEKVADLMTKADTARMTTRFGTNITMSLKGRKALPLHPLTELAVTAIPDTAETAIAPVEGSAEGVIVADASVRGWGKLLRSPLKFEVSHGRVVIDSVTSDIREDADKFRQLLRLDENAVNCAAELGIGTSHLVPKSLGGSFLLDYSVVGTFHIAVGRNNDIGGQTHSTLHQDVLMTGGTIYLDDLCIMKDGELQI